MLRWDEDTRSLGHPPPRRGTRSGGGRGARPSARGDRGRDQPAGVPPWAGPAPPRGRGAERAADLLRLEAAELCRHDGIATEPGALERVQRYADRLMPARHLPGKAFALLDEAAREALGRPDRRVTAARVTDRVCESLRLPR